MPGQLPLELQRSCCSGIPLFSLHLERCLGTEQVLSKEVSDTEGGDVTGCQLWSHHGLCLQVSPH